VASLLAEHRIELGLLYPEFGFEAGKPAGANHAIELRAVVFDHPDAIDHYIVHQPVARRVFQHERDFDGIFARLQHRGANSRMVRALGAGNLSKPHFFAVERSLGRRREWSRPSRRRAGEGLITLQKNENSRIIWALLTRGDNYRRAVPAEPGNQAA
jgi:hypothetical protein